MKGYPLWWKVIARDMGKEIGDVNWEGEELEWGCKGLEGYHEIVGNGDSWVGKLLIGNSWFLVRDESRIHFGEAVWFEETLWLQDFPEMLS